MDKPRGKEWMKTFSRRKTTEIIQAYSTYMVHNTVRSKYVLTTDYGQVRTKYDCTKNILWLKKEEKRRSKLPLKGYTSQLRKKVWS